MHELEDARGRTGHEGVVAVERKEGGRAGEGWEGVDLGRASYRSIQLQGA